MFKKIFLIVIAIILSQSSFGQSADSVYNRYLDFNLARFQGEQDKEKELGEALIPLADKLPEKARINFYFAIGKMYEDDGRPGKAMSYYEKVTVAVPDYYVAHRALGYIYLEEVKSIEKQLNASVGKSQLANRQLSLTYNAAVKKTLPQLEKAQACDPSDETLVIIQLLYKDIRGAKGLSSLNKRLKQLSKNCVDILSDQ